VRAREREGERVAGEGGGVVRKKSVCVPHSPRHIQAKLYMISVIL